MKVTHHPEESVFKNQPQEKAKHSSKHKLTEEDQQLLKKMRHEQNESNADAAERADQKVMDSIADTIMGEIKTKEKEDRKRSKENELWTLL
jgi:hypothetical protein